MLPEQGRVGPALWLAKDSIAERGGQGIMIASGSIDERRIMGDEE